MAKKFRWALFLFSLQLCGMGMLPGFAAQSQGSFQLRVDVELVTMEVTVLDKKGKPVRNLKKEDFQLFEDGKRQEIQSFDEVTANQELSSLGVAPMGDGALHRGKNVLILFDDSTIASQHIQMARDCAAKYVKEYMRPQDLFAVASFGASMKVLQNFTSEPQEVLAAIGQPSGSNPSGRFYFEDLLRALEKINYSVAQLKGPKSILIFTQADYSYGASLQNTYANTLKSAKRSNVVYYTIDPSTTISGSPVDSTPRPVPSPILNRTNPLTSEGVIPVTLKSLASESGGYSIFNTNAVHAELGNLDLQISNYYILGFQSSNPVHDGAFRKVNIKTNLKGATLKHRGGYQDRRPVDTLASSKHEKTLLTAMALPSAVIQIPIAFRPVYFYDSPKTARVLLAARISMGKLAFKKRGAQLSTDLNIMGVAYAEDGGIAARFSETLPVSFDGEREAEFRNGNLVYRNYLKVRPGKYRLKLAASDESSNLGSQEISMEVPAFPEKALVGSSLVIAEQVSRVPDLIQNLQTQMLNESDPLIYAGMQIEPSVGNRLPANSIIPILFRIYNLPTQANPRDLTVTARLIGENGTAFALDPIPLKMDAAPPNKTEAVIALRLLFKDVPPGKYRLIIETTDAASAQKVALQTDLELMPNS